ncbi:hypothetical protein WJX72_007976 [[Myrmecia] bisecta]|uniref:F-box domain-containing protein n=1 Tax=[Myrmecia] bisecta TaxID=41462 RepID=A0AAW1PYX0_9CHLO
MMGSDSLRQLRINHCWNFTLFAMFGDEKYESWQKHTGKQVYPLPLEEARVTTLPSLPPWINLFCKFDNLTSLVVECSMYFTPQQLHRLPIGLRTLVIPIARGDNEPIPRLWLSRFRPLRHLEVLKLRADAAVFAMESEDFYGNCSFTRLHTLEVLDVPVTGYMLSKTGRGRMEILCLHSHAAPAAFTGQCSLRRLRLQYVVQFTNCFIENLPVSDETMAIICRWFPDLSNLAVGVDTMAGLSTFKHMDNLAITVNGEAVDTTRLPDTRVLFLGCSWTQDVAPDVRHYVRDGATCDIRGLARMPRLEKVLIVARYHAITGHTDPALVTGLYQKRPKVSVRIEVHHTLGSDTLSLFKSVRRRTNGAFHGLVDTGDIGPTRVDVVTFPDAGHISDIGIDHHLMHQPMRKLTSGWAMYDGKVRDLHWDPLDEPRTDRMHTASWSSAYELDYE